MKNPTHLKSLLNYIKNGNEGIIENDRYTNHACILKKYQNNSMSDNYNNNIFNMQNINPLMMM